MTEPGRGVPAAPAGQAPPGVVPQRPAAMLRGRGHVIVHANAAFVDEFGASGLGLPAAETIVDLPPEAFALLDLAFREGRAVACAIRVRGTDRRLVLDPWRDIESGDVYGVRLHLVPAPARPAGRGEAAAGDPRDVADDAGRATGADRPVKGGDRPVRGAGA